MNKTDLTIRQASENERNSWDRSVTHPIQLWAWGDFRKSMGIDTERLAVIKNGEFTNGWQITFHRIPHTSYTIGYFPKGPLPDKFMIDELVKIGRKYRAIFVQLEPNIISDFRIPFEKTQGKQISEFRILKPSHHPLFTKFNFILDLTKSESELLAAMHPKTRYNIRVAQKHGVLVREDNSDQAFKAYLKLNEETTQRQGFYAHNAKYHEEMWKIMHQAGVAKLWTVSFEGEILTAWIIFTFKDTVYYPYGASSRSHREVMAPNLLLWEIARWAKSQQFKYFDLWGALGPNPDPADPWYGFHRFKQGYNPTPVEYIGSYDLMMSPMLYQIYKTADIVRWKLLKSLK